MKKIKFFTLIFLIFSYFNIFPQQNTELFEKHVFVSYEGDTLPYRLLLPEGYNPEYTYPMVVFLHGSGERGTDNEKQLIHGVTVFAQPSVRAKYPAIVVAPQCPPNQRWADWGGEKYPERYHQVEALTRPMTALLQLISEMQTTYSVNSQRLYLTGLSMGGHGSFDLLLREPEMFAAAAIVCAGGDLRKADRFAHLPLWLFHGDADSVVPVAASREMAVAVKKAGGKPKYTEYPGVNHNSWENAYADPKLLQWMFKQKRK